MDLNEVEKSVLLARARGWEVYESREEYFKAGMLHATEYDANIEHPAYFHPEHRTSNVLPNLYKPINMSLAWEWHMWAIQEPFGHTYLAYWDLMSPWLQEDMQKQMLDNILKLVDL